MQLFFRVEVGWRVNVEIWTVFDCEVIENRSCCVFVLWFIPLGLIKFACGEKQILELIGPHHSIGPRSPEGLGQEDEGHRKDRWEFLRFFRVGEAG